MGRRLVTGGHVLGLCNRRATGPDPWLRGVVEPRPSTDCHEGGGTTGSPDKASRGRAAVDHQHVSGDERGEIRSEPRRGETDVLGHANAPSASLAALFRGLSLDLLPQRGALAPP